jgi:hypothetical protein
MAILREKADELLQVAQAIEDENYWDDVTADEQRLLEEVVRAVRAAGNLLMLHVRVTEQLDADVEPLQPDVPQKRKLRVVK